MQLSYNEFMSGAVRSLSEWTSTARSVITGCCYCYNKDSDHGGFKKKKQHAGKAWFDCEQLQTEQPFCYANPVALSYGADSSSLTLYQELSPPQPNSSENIPKGSTNLDTRSYERELHCLPSANLKCTIEETVLTDPRLKGDSESSLTDASKCAQIHINTSFASQLEEDYFFRRNDLLRADGDTLTPKFKRAFERKREKVTSPLSHRKCWSNKRDNGNAVNWDELSFDEEDFITDEKHNFGDIWGSNELQAIFEGYNATSFNSFGNVQSILEKPSLPARTRHERFEEIFPIGPTKPSRSLNNQKRRHHKDSHSEFYIPPEREDTWESSSESTFLENNSSSNSHSLDKLKHFIHESYLKSHHHLESKDHSKKRPNLFFNCDKSLICFGKCFNDLLVFDLVKELLIDCASSYSYSHIRCNYKILNHTETVQNLVLDTLESKRFFIEKISPFTREIEEIRSRVLAISPSQQSVKVPDSLLIEKVAASEIAKESRSWQNFEDEEEKVKEEISIGIFNDLINGEIIIINSALDKKLKAIT